MGYQKSAIKGISWIGGLRGTTRIIAFVRTAILARLLVPAQFGIFGIATLVLSFLEVFTETGINIVLIQEKEDIDDYINTAWIVSILRGFIISIILVALAPLISLFFNSSDSLRTLLLISFVPLIRGFINPSVVKFHKELQFKREFWYRFSISGVGSLVAVVIAYLTRSVESLVIGLIIETIYETVASYIIAKPWPRLAFEVDKFKKVIKRGKWITGVGIFSYLFREGDDIVVGKILGEAPLGIYQLSYKISTLPVTEISDVFGKVTFPIYTKIASDIIRLRKAFIKAFIVSSMLIVPFGLFLYIFAKPLVLIFLGQAWLEAVPAVRVLSIFGVIRAIVGLTHSLFYSLEKQHYVTAITLAGIVGMGTSIIPLVNRFGFVGAGYSTIIGSLASAPVAAFCLWKVFYAK